MCEIVDLLKEYGIVVDPNDFIIPRIPSPIFPNIPHHYHDGIAIFTGDQYEISPPEDVGFLGPYFVTEATQKYSLNYDDEILLPKKRPVHRYDRKSRFKFILGQLTGCCGEVDSTIIDHFKKLNLTVTTKIWDTVRSELKRNNWQFYYNRIPNILGELGFLKSRYSKHTSSILNDFEKMHKVWPLVKKDLNRVYFPNLRFVALKLLQKYNCELVCEIPLTRTLRKETSLNELYDNIWKRIIFEELFE